MRDRNRPPLDQLLRELTFAFQPSIDAQTEMTATEIGRRSFSLRERARAFMDRGKHDEGFALYVQALQLHSDEDNGPEAAAARHDLGEAYRNRVGGSRVENLRASEKLLRRALESEARRRDPARWASTCRTLASTLRMFAREVGDPDGARLNEAREFLRTSIKEFERGGDFLALDVAHSYDTLANLENEAGNLDVAITAANAAVKAAKRGFKARAPIREDFDDERRYWGFRFSALRKRLARGSGKDLRHITKTLPSLLQQAPTRARDTGRIILARALLRRGRKGERERAKKILRGVEPTLLSEPELQEFIVALTAAKMTTEAITVLESAAFAAIERRRDVMADYLADHEERHAQDCARTAAVMRARRGDALKTFLLLENVAGLRFEEVYRRFRWRPRGSFEYRLFSLIECLKAIASMTDDLAGTAAHMESAFLDLVVPQLDQASAMLDENPSTAITKLIDEAQHDWIKRVREARTRPDPASALRAQTDALKTQIFALEAELRQRDPEYDPDPGTLGYNVTKTELERLLTENSDAAFMRISIGGEVVAAVVFQEAGVLQSRVSVQKVRIEQLKAVWSLRQHGANAPERAMAEGFVRALDLSPLLDGITARRLYILPSDLASYVPLGAVGPVGKTPIDRFISVSWLPCLAPLRARPCAELPRFGRTTLSPSGTSMARDALRHPVEGETMIEAGAATLQAALDAARSADVLAFYTHGVHEECECHIELDGDERLGTEHVSRSDWRGIERVELWACQSGVDTPTDPRGTMANEFFGLDGRLLYSGVRSTLATLWPIHELPTCAIVHHYRASLSRGHRADEALVLAQRWWRDEGLPELLAHVEDKPIEEALEEFWSTLGSGSDAPSATDLVGDAEESRAELTRRMRALFGSPLGWGGYRFCGVCERRPAGTYDPDPIERPPTEAEEHELRELFESARSPAAQPSFEHAIEVELRQHCSEFEPPLHAERALELARLYQARLVSSRRHNLVAALAWLAEGLATSGLGADAQQSLQRESLVCWIEIVLDDVWHPSVLLARFPSVEMRVALERARRLCPSVEGIAAEPLRRLVEVCAVVLLDKTDARIATVATEALLACARWLDATPLKHDVLEDEATCHALYAWITTLRLLGGTEHHKKLGELASRLLAPFTARATGGVVPFRKLALWDRCMAAAASLSFHVEAAPTVMPPARGRLNANELTEYVRGQADAIQREPLGAGRQHTVLISEALGQREVALWDSPTGGGGNMLLSTGGVGPGYRLLTEGYIEGHVVKGDGSDRFAGSVIASLQYSADLRLLFQNRARKFAVSMLEIHARGDELIDFIWSHVGACELVMSHLCDVLGAPLELDLPDGTRVTRIGEFDPLVLDRKRVREALEQASPGHQGDPPDVVALWLLTDFAKTAPDGARTLAFAAVRDVETMRYQLLDRWLEFRRLSDQAVDELGVENSNFSFWRYLEPALKLERNQTMLEECPSGHCVLALSVSTLTRRVIAAVVWNRDGRRGMRLRASDDGVSDTTRLALLRLLHPTSADFGSRRGESGDRAKLWEDIVAALAPLLDEILGDVLTPSAPRMSLSVLAPGPLRVLPLLGLRVRGRPLRTLASDVVALPALGWPTTRHHTRSAPATPLACWFEPLAGDEPQHAFGARVISGIRRLFKPHALLGADGHRGRDVPEATQLERIAEELRTLRFYGSGYTMSLTDADSGLALNGGRGFLAHNVCNTKLCASTTVELWAATSDQSEMSRICENRADRVPGLARAFLAAGADGVLDLAWPVHDLIKALVCERYTMLRHAAGAAGPVALNAALEWVSWLSSGLLTDGVAAIGEITSRIDRLRGDGAAEFKLDPAALLPFTGISVPSAAQGEAGRDFVQEISRHSHTAAFRWWGG